MSRVSLLTSILLLVFGLFVVAPTGFAEEGYATWYGPGFHGNRMANGQVYDMYDPTTTAANRWPFGTWLRVTNPANGKSVTVQVRDRGAFNHLVDLSYAAFLILDDPKKMMIRVNVEVVPGPDAPPPDSQDEAPAAPQPTPKPEVPAPAPSAAKPPAPAPDEHVVLPGETLSTIAKKYGVPVKTLVAINGIADADQIRTGQRLKLKETARPAEPSRGATDEGVALKIGSSTEYVVKPGDTLRGIANRLGIDVDTLASLNGIDDPNLIVEGQKLRTTQDVGPSSGKTDAAASTREKSGDKRVHTVAAGETLGSIALKYDVSGEDLATANGLSDPDLIAIGQELEIPSGAVTSNATEPRQQRSAPKQHVVKPGETLGEIAFLYDVEVASIARVNGIDDPNLLQPGDVLTIP